MTKKILLVISFLILVIGCLYFYQKYNLEHSIIQKFDKLSEEQKNETIKDINEFTSQTVDLKNNLSKLGVPTLPISKQRIENIMVDTELKASDAGIKTGMKNIPAFAELYFDQNKNYGNSNTNNACVSSDPDTFNFSSALLEINKLSKTPAKCAVSSQFPSKTFTIIIPSLVNDGLYCTDQNGFAGLINNDSSPFVSGVKCK